MQSILDPKYAFNLLIFYASLIYKDKVHRKYEKFQMFNKYAYLVLIQRMNILEALFWLPNMGAKITLINLAAYLKNTKNKFNKNLNNLNNIKISYLSICATPLKIKKNIKRS